MLFIRLSQTPLRTLIQNKRSMLGLKLLPNFNYQYYIYFIYLEKAILIVILLFYFIINKRIEQSCQKQWRCDTCQICSIEIKKKATHPHDILGVQSCLYFFQRCRFFFLVYTQPTRYLSIKTYVQYTFYWNTTHNQISHLGIELIHLFIMS